MSERPLVLLVTCSRVAEGEPGHAALDAALAARGIDSRWVTWDDESVEWSDAAVIAVRATWDYDSRVGEFLGWASGLGPRPEPAQRLPGLPVERRQALPPRPPGRRPPGRPDARR